MRYEHEQDRPKEAKAGHMVSMQSCKDFKKEAMDTAYGQAGNKGCVSDEKKIHAQFNTQTFSDSNSGY